MGARTAGSWEKNSALKVPAARRHQRDQQRPLVHMRQKHPLCRGEAAPAPGQRTSSGHLPTSVNKVHGNPGNSPGESQKSHELDACHLCEWRKCGSFASSLFLLVCLPPSQRLCFPGETHSAIWEQDALQALNGVSGDL